MSMFRIYEELFFYEIDCNDRQQIDTNEMKPATLTSYGWQYDISKGKVWVLQLKVGIKF